MEAVQLYRLALNTKRLKMKTNFHVCSIMEGSWIAHVGHVITSMLDEQTWVLRWEDLRTNIHRVLNLPNLDFGVLTSRGHSCSFLGGSEVGVELLC